MAENQNWHSLVARRFWKSSDWKPYWNLHGSYSIHNHTIKTTIPGLLKLWDGMVEDEARHWWTVLFFGILRAGRFYSCGRNGQGSKLRSKFKWKRSPPKDMLVSNFFSLFLEQISGKHGVEKGGFYWRSSTQLCRKELSRHVRSRHQFHLFHSSEKGSFVW